MVMNKSVFINSVTVHVALQRRLGAYPTARRVKTRPTLKRTRARDVIVPTRAVSIGNISVRLAIHLRK